MFYGSKVIGHTPENDASMYPYVIFWNDGDIMGTLNPTPPVSTGTMFDKWGKVVEPDD